MSGHLRDRLAVFDRYMAAALESGQPPNDAARIALAALEIRERLIPVLECGDRDAEAAPEVLAALEWLGYSGP